MFDTIEFRLAKFYFDSDDEPCDVVQIDINGKELLQIAKECELPNATKDKQVSIAGTYSYLNLYDFKRLFLDVDERERHVLLACTCGERGCWFLQTELKFDACCVEMLNFTNPYRKHWEYGLNFKFDASQFACQVSKIRAQIKNQLQGRT